TPAYAGRSQGFPGLDQIVFTLPASAAGCFVPVQVRAGGVVSNVVSVSISDSSPCADATITADIARKLGMGGTVNVGEFELLSTGAQTPGVSLGGLSLPPMVTYGESIAGTFASVSADAFFATRLNSTASGCTPFKQTGDITHLAFGPIPKGLDAGASLTG